MLMAAHSRETSCAPVDDASLLARFSPLFERIAHDAVRRERLRELPFEAVRALVRHGFGALRVPASYGGGGASLPQLLQLLVALAAADSNVAQIFRAHFAFVEGELTRADGACRERWFPRIAAGELIGAAMSERIAATDITTRLRSTPHGGWHLDGEKFYCTGGLHADWMTVYALDEHQRFTCVMVSTQAPGVTREDDWDGFGQRMTASGTTRFARVAVPADHLLRQAQAGQAPQEAHLMAFFQLYHLATLAGIGQAAQRDAIAYTLGRTRAFRIPGLSSPRQDPLVQRVIGRLASLAYAARSLVEHNALVLQQLVEDARRGSATEAQYTAVDLQVYQAQQVIAGLVLDATSLLFEVGGASALSTARQLDRHWRNARALASHNPAIHREQALGNYYLNGVTPAEALRAQGPVGASAAAADGASAAPQST